MLVNAHDERPTSLFSLIEGRHVLHKLDPSLEIKDSLG